MGDGAMHAHGTHSPSRPEYNKRLFLYTSTSTVHITILHSRLPLHRKVKAAAAAFFHSLFGNKARVRLLP